MIIRKRINEQTINEKIDCHRQREKGRKKKNEYQTIKLQSQNTKRDKNDRRQMNIRHKQNIYYII